MSVVAPMIFTWKDTTTVKRRLGLLRAFHNYLLLEAILIAYYTWQEEILYLLHYLLLILDVTRCERVMTSST